MLHRKRIRLTLVIAFLAPLLQWPLESPARADERLPVLQLKHEVRGLHRKRRSPGADAAEKVAEKATEEESVTLQYMTVDRSGKQLMLRTVDAAGQTADTPLTDGANRVLLRMDREPPEIYTFFDARKQYRAHESDLNKYQGERDIIEAQEIRRILSDKTMSESNQDAQLKKSFLRRDGKRVVEVREGNRERILDYDCQEVEVTENGRTIFHGWVTTDLGAGTSFYQLYRRLGTFSRQVLDKIRAIQGVPLRATILVVTAGPPRKLEVRCVEVLDKSTVPANFFELPADYQKYEEAPAIAPCPICGKRVERDQAGAAYVDPIRGVRRYFYSRDCRKEYIKAVRRRQKETREQASGNSPGSGTEKDK